MPCLTHMEFANLKENSRMIAKKGPVVWALMIALTLTLSAWGAGQRRNQQQAPSALDQIGNQPQQKQQSVIQIATKEEGDAYNATIKETDPARKIGMSEEFISKFPSSDLVATAQMIRFVSYSQLQKHKEAVAAGEQAIDATVKL